jgi:L-lactate dehydrogenase complex protein LldE
MKKIQLFITCFGEQFFSGTLQNMVRIFERLGVAVSFPESQSCCGQPFFNNGFNTEARGVARGWLAAFGESDLPIVSPSASCVAMVRHHYPELFPPGSPEHALAVDLSQRTFEFTEYLTHHLNITDVGASFPHKVTYHASCHLLREMKMRDEPKQLLKAVRGLEFVEMEEEETCCGFGGSLSVLYPASARQCPAIKPIILSTARWMPWLGVAEAGCLMNIAGALRKANSPIKALHLIDVLAAQEEIR